MIRYKSTRGGDESKRSTEAIIQGIAADKGLFVPETIPALPFKPEQKTATPYHYSAFHILKSFLPDFTDEELKRCIEGAYDSRFEAAEIAPLVKAGSAYFLELYHGRTAAFKDMALSILPYLLTTAMNKEKEEKKVVILTATSGDTGKAALEGFSDVPGTEIVVFYPKDGVSQVQERQMLTQSGKNTHVFAIRGNFDDAQAGVKKIFNDEAFAAKLAAKGYRLSSANSINIGRLAPQIVYYVYAYIKLLELGAVETGAPMNVVIPTGNFGNILAAYYAKRMGLPVRRLICASNRNKILTDFIRTGVYDANRDFYVTNSPSMDILISSNLERLLYHLSGDSAGETAALMAKLEESRKYCVTGKIREGLKDFYGGFAGVEETNETIGKLYQDEKYLVDTHTAVAYKVYEDYLKETGDGTPAVIASTASPYKFADSVAKSIGLQTDADEFENIRLLHEHTGVAVPDALKNLEGREIRHSGVVDVGGMADAVSGSLE
ncbi:MAG: threonine synthase [Clostridiales Family XIII bacterium]|jgi:threonine synthase|nr:threonine synthase [Clostridiales Family XIII bacterium]